MILVLLVLCASTFFALMNFSAMTVGQRIAHARQARGWSQTELGRACDMAPTQVSRYEAGRAAPRRVTMAKIADALAVRFQWLVSGDGGMEEYSTETPDQWLTFSISGEIADRLKNYAMKSGLSLEDALADILDFPLSVFGPDDEAYANDSEILKATPRRQMRVAALRGKVRLDRSRN